MKKSDLSKLVREAVINNHVENIDPESENYKAQAERATICLPKGAKLGDDNLSFLSFRMDASAFKGLTNEEITEFMVEQFPEHSWGMLNCIEDNGLLSVYMHEARAYITLLIRKYARILIFGNIKKKKFILGVTLDANKVLPFISENKFVQLVTDQFPQHNWRAKDCRQIDGHINVLLYSSATKGKLPRDSRAKNVTLIEDTYMIAVPLVLDGIQEPVDVVMENISSSLEALAVTVFIHSELATVFGESSVLRFIEEQFPSYTILPQTKDTDSKSFSVALVKNEQVDLTD